MDRIRDDDAFEIFTEKRHADAFIALVGSSDRDASSGVYHLTSGGLTSWHGFTAAILAHLAANEPKLASLTAIPTSGYPTPAARPANSQLDCGKLADTFGVRLPHWQEALALCLEQEAPCSGK